MTMAVSLQERRIPAIGFINVQNASIWSALLVSVRKVSRVSLSESLSKKSKLDYRAF